MTPLALAAGLASAGCFADEAPKITGADASSDGASTGGVTDGSTAEPSSSASASMTDASASSGVSGTCGNGVVEPGEACDDGGVEAGDGCSPECAMEPLYAFVSAGRINGNAGTIADVDAKCQSEAVASGLPGTYYAWLSFDAESAPAVRFAPHGRPYVLPGADMPQVAVGLAGLLSPSHEHGINRDADGVELPAQDGCTVASLVWTGTNNDGKIHNDNCSGFTSADVDVKGRAGRYTGNGSGWSSNCGFDCSNSLPFYCFQQP